MRVNLKAVSMLVETPECQLGVGYVIGDGYYINEYLPNGNIRSSGSLERGEWVRLCTDKNIPDLAMVYLSNAANQLEMLSGTDYRTRH